MISPKERAVESDVSALRETLFRLLGKCLVQAQAVELLLKRLLAVRTFGGTVEELEEQLAARHADYKTNTLGTLVKEVLGSYLVSGSYEHPEAPEAPPSSRMYVHFHHVLTMSDERLVEMRQLFTALVSTRNDAVHHLAELFPLKTAEGLTHALEFLGGFERCLDEAWAEVKAWAEAHDKSRELAGQFMREPEFENLLFDGIYPDGSVNWEVAGIVRALRNAADALYPGNWTPLDAAVVWIRREAPLQIPSRYKCATYRQAIHESKAFEVKRECMADGSTHFLYRSKRH